MNPREHIWTVLFAVLFTLLIWLWAEGENRERLPTEASAIFYATNATGDFRLRIQDPSNPTSLVPEVPIQLVMEGPNLALKRLSGQDQRLRIPIESATDGSTREIDMLEAVQDLPLLVNQGITVTQVTPPRLVVRTDEIERRSIAISPTIPGLSGVTIESITVQPKQVEVSMSRSDWQWAISQFGRDLVYLDINPAELRALEAGQVYRTSNARVRLQPTVAQLPLVKFDATPVSVEISIQRHLAEVGDLPVPVKVNLPIRDAPYYRVLVDVEHELIPDVTLSGDAETIRRLRDNEIKVRAIIDLSSDELEQGITQKRIDWFLPPGLRVVAPAERPIIPFRIERIPLPEE